jgi:hypothetical protein
MKIPLATRSVPYLISIAIFMLGTLINTTNKIDDKLFKHLTNDDLHVLRSTVVSKGEFDIVTKMREQQFCSIQEQLNRLSGLLERQSERTR